MTLLYENLTLIFYPFSAISNLIYDSILSGASSAFFDFTAFRSE